MECARPIEASKTESDVDPPPAVPPHYTAASLPWKAYPHRVLGVQRHGRRAGPVTLRPRFLRYATTVRFLPASLAA